MKCDECQTLVQEYFDGELDQLSATAVSSHVANCSSCSAALEQLAFEHRAYQQYDRELDVSPALWLRVQAQLPDETSRQNLTRFSRPRIKFSNLLSLRFSVAASVALALFAVLVTVAVMRYLNKQEISKQLTLASRPLPGKTTDGSEPAKSATVESPPEKSAIKEKTGPGYGPARGKSGPEREYAKTPGQLVREAEKKYLSAIALLTRDSQQRQSQLDSETRAQLDRALAAIDRTILSTRKAVRRNPNDPRAVQYMLAAYGKKVDVLKEMVNYQ
jgi:hypothetical protein